MVTTMPTFPIVDAILLTPKEGQEGAVGICTNTSAPGQILNEIEDQRRKSVSVLGSLMVSRDGTERMILNALAHPTIRYIILFSEESLTFSPSTNLLLALQHGIDTSKPGNYIVDGKAASAHYPNLSKKIVDAFRENITVIPLFMYRNDYSKQVVLNYLEWVKPRIGEDIYDYLKETAEKKNIYYDALNSLIEMVERLPRKEKGCIELDPKEFQHLQPPKVTLEGEDLSLEVPFRVSAEGDLIRVDIAVENESYFMKGKEEFRIEYSLMKFLGEKKSTLAPLEQLTLGAELARVDTEIKNRISIPTSVQSANVVGTKEIPIEPNVSLVPDKEFYYKVSVRDKDISVMCLAFDVCREVFELRSPKAGGIFAWLAEKNRFETYEMDILHRMDVGGQVSRAGIAAQKGFAFIQDFSNIFKINTTELPTFTIEGDSFLDVHKSVLRKIYTEGLTEEHGDKQKGLARSAVVLAVYRNAEQALGELPSFYKQGEQSTKEMREKYKRQLLRFDHDGDYSYGERTRKHFGHDQLLGTINALEKDGARAAAMGRFDQKVDMGSSVDPGSGKTKYTHDPCLVYDIFIPRGGKLHSFHMARAHNMVNAYPENIFGLHDAYVTMVRKKLGLSSGDLYMLSSRANILLLTEEQRTKKVLMEPSKPAGAMDTTSGPYELGGNIKEPSTEGVVAYTILPMKEVGGTSNHPLLKRLRDFAGVDTVERAISYYKNKGAMHNNPVLSEFEPGVSDPQADMLVFFQTNVMGGRLHSTAVYQNRSLQNFKKDVEVLECLSGEFSTALKKPLGNLSIYYVGYRP